MHYTPQNQKFIAVWGDNDSVYKILSKKVKVAECKDLIFDEKYFATKAYHLPRKLSHKKFTEEQLLKLEKELNKTSTCETALEK